MKLLSILSVILLFCRCEQPPISNNAIDVDKFQAALIEVALKDSSTLFILLAKDGTVNRQGDLKTKKKNFFMGVSKEKLFDSLIKTIDTDLSSYFDKVVVQADTNRRVNKIKIGFTGPEGNTGFEIYTDEPIEKIPKPILNFINNAIRVTEPWYKNQQDMLKP
jgi:hypothetical protein